MIAGRKFGESIKDAETNKPTFLFASFCQGAGEKPNFLMISLFWFRLYCKYASFVFSKIMSSSGPEINVNKAPSDLKGALGGLGLSLRSPGGRESWGADRGWQVLQRTHSLNYVRGG